MKTVLIIGAGGHGQVVADSLKLSAEYTPLGFVDDRAELSGTTIAKLPVLGTVAHIPALEFDEIIVAIGVNSVRQALFEQLQQYQFATAIHPSAIIAQDVPIGAGTMICAGAIINTATVIGRNSIINTGATVDHHNQISDHVHLAPGTHLGGGVTVETGGFVGIGATIMPARTIGAWATVGAGGLVHQNVPPQTTVVGVPATPLIKT